MTTSQRRQAPARLRSHLRDLKLFALSPEGRPALLGALGAALIAAGGLGAGSTRVNDPVLESMHRASSVCASARTARVRPQSPAFAALNGRASTSGCADAVSSHTAHGLSAFGPGDAHV